ncbi:ATP-binding cassette domain-containing protein [Undibacterium sp. TS12]|uniref:sulfate/molybdate ABC transporter ATP-binding protein n=1 Tax=Undibacterium sp. TS12 TaxID=2908202 RepID=UPI001F4CB5A0|nr:ATP-binding cassette domain-containing protein [Undibacterium sp. TS12]MCH8622319.1 ATP-binding cassette domain-containing protein [Undibacterium sp. TS12]
MQFDLHIKKNLRSGKRSFELDIAFGTDSQRLVILGASGAGKSLVLKAIAGLMTPDSGYIRIAGATLFDKSATINLAPQQRQLAYLFQDYALFPHLNVAQNIAFGLSRGWRNPSARVQNEKVDYWLQAFQLQAQAGQLPHELSGGQKQRTALARALISEPRALLLDEPFAALDQPLRISMRKELDALQKQLQVPMILITHDAEDAAVFGEQILHLQEGRLCKPGQEQAESLALITGG